MEKTNCISGVNWNDLYGMVCSNGVCCRKYQRLY